MTDNHDAKDRALEAALARALGPAAEDTAPLSRAVLSRIAETGAAPPTRPWADVLVDPRPLAGLMLGALLLAGALGYRLVPADLSETVALVHLIGGF